MPPKDGPDTGKRSRFGEWTPLRLAIVAAVIVVLVLGAAFLIIPRLPHRSVPSGDSARVKCLFHLQEAHMEGGRYSQAHGGHFPPQAPAAIGGKGASDCTYFYFPPTSPTYSVSDPDKLIIACDLKPAHPGTRNVLYLGGGVESMPDTQFESELAQPVNAEFDAAYRKARGR